MLLVIKSWCAGSPLIESIKTTSMEDVSTKVLEKKRIFKKVKPKNDLMYQDIYNCMCQNTKRIRFIIHYVKPTAQLLFNSLGPRQMDAIWQTTFSGAFT